MTEDSKRNHPGSRQISQFHFNQRSRAQLEALPIVIRRNDSHSLEDTPPTIASSFVGAVASVGVGVGDVDNRGAPELSVSIGGHPSPSLPCPSSMAPEPMLILE